MDSSYNEISNALQDYFDGFYDSDVATLKRIFHPNAHLYSAVDQEVGGDAVGQRVAGHHVFRHGVGLGK